VGWRDTRALVSRHPLLSFSTFRRVPASRPVPYCRGRGDGPLLKSFLLAAWTSSSAAREMQLCVALVGICLRAGVTQRPEPMCPWRVHTLSLCFFSCPFIARPFITTVHLMVTCDGPVVCVGLMVAVRRRRHGLTVRRSREHERHQERTRSACCSPMSAVDGEKEHASSSSCSSSGRQLASLLQLRSSGGASRLVCLWPLATGPQCGSAAAPWRNGSRWRAPRR